MDPSIRYIITRAFSVIALIVALLYGYGFVKKHQRKSAIIDDLKIICGESSFYQQFSNQEAQKALIRAIGLIADADSLGLSPDDAIKSGLGLDREWFVSESDAEETPLAQQIIRSSLRANYDNFVKLGFKTDFNTIKAMKEGELPTISSGSLAGRKPIIKTLIPPEASPGIEKVLANLELAPPGSEAAPLTDIQLAAAKQLARDLFSARLIEQPVRDRIITYLTPEEDRKQ
jgi:hypothetical protein